MFGGVEVYPVGLVNVTHGVNSGKTMPAKRMPTIPAALHLRGRSRRKSTAPAGFVGARPMQGRLALD